MVTDLEKTAFYLGINYHEYLDFIREQIESLEKLHTDLVSGRISKIEAKGSLYDSSIEGFYSACKSLITKFGLNDAARLEDMKVAFDFRYRQVKGLLGEK